MGRKHTHTNTQYRTKFPDTNADKEIFIFPVHLTTCRIGNLTRLIHALAICGTIHTYIGRSTVVQYGLLSVLGVISNSIHIPHRIFGRISNNFYHPSVPQVYTASLPRTLQPMRTTFGAFCQLHKLQEELVRDAEVSAKVSGLSAVAAFQLCFREHYRPRRRGEIRFWVDLPSALHTGTTAIPDPSRLRRLHVL